MKAYREEEKFTPVHIILETKEEAEEFWHRLKCEDDESFDAYCSSKGLTCRPNYGFAFVNALSEAFLPY